MSISENSVSQWKCGFAKVPLSTHIVVPCHIFEQAYGEITNQQAQHVCKVQVKR